MVFLRHSSEYVLILSLKVDTARPLSSPPSFQARGDCLRYTNSLECANSLDIVHGCFILRVRKTVTVASIQAINTRNRDGCLPARHSIVLLLAKYMHGKCTKRYIWRRDEAEFGIAYYAHDRRKTSPYAQYMNTYERVSLLRSPSVQMRHSHYVTFIAYSTPAVCCVTSMWYTCQTQCICRVGNPLENLRYIPEILASYLTTSVWPMIAALGVLCYWNPSSCYSQKSRGQGNCGINVMSRHPPIVSLTSQKVKWGGDYRKDVGNSATIGEHVPSPTRQTVPATSSYTLVSAPILCLVASSTLYVLSPSQCKRLATKQHITIREVTHL